MLLPNDSSQTEKKLTDRISLLRVFLALLVLDALLLLSGKAMGLATILTLIVACTGFVLAIRLTRYMLRKSIWRLRNRLYVTYVFVGVVPLVLLVMLLIAGTWIVVGQVAVYLISSELERSAGLLSNPAEMIARADEKEMDTIVSQLAPVVRNRMSNFEVLVKGPRGTYRFPANSRLEEPVNMGDFTGFVRSKGRVYLWHCKTTPNGRHVVVASPLSPKLIQKLAPALGTVQIADSVEGGGLIQTSSTPVGVVPAPYNLFDFLIAWPIGLTVRSDDKAVSTSLVVETRPSAVLGAVFGSKLETGQNVVLIVVVLISLLLMTEMISFVIGMSLTRTITGAVHDLYEGTQKIAVGDFSYRIPVKGTDQLAELGNSFNDMSAQIEKLVVIAKEKERMESELEIAREVQAQLFPRSAPTMRTMKLTGLCRPARSVSGDYYDYLCLPDGNLAFALGDVAGKGISAALLMASIQSIMRTQLAAGLPVSTPVSINELPSRHSTCGVVAQLNKQLYANTSPEKYATFFFGFYEESSRILTYTNAGHLPPLLLHNGEVTPLEVTGTVVGAFPKLTYGEKTVHIAAGDLLVLYTDGITEPENAYGEEFGEQRLGDLISKLQGREPDEIVAKVMEAVCEWSSAPELPDDMTVMIAQGIA